MTSIKGDNERILAPRIRCPKCRWVWQPRRRSDGSDSQPVACPSCSYRPGRPNAELKWQVVDAT